MYVCVFYRIFMSDDLMKSVQVSVHAYICTFTFSCLIGSFLSLRSNDYLPFFVGIATNFFMNFKLALPLITELL